MEKAARTNDRDGTNTAHPKRNRPDVPADKDNGNGEETTISAGDVPQRQTKQQRTTFPQPHSEGTIADLTGDSDDDGEQMFGSVVRAPNNSAACNPQVEVAQEPELGATAQATSRSSTIPTSGATIPTEIRLRLTLEYTPIPATNHDLTQVEEGASTTVEVRTVTIDPKASINEISSPLYNDPFDRDIRSIDMYIHGDPAPVPWRFSTSPWSLQLRDQQDIRVVIHYRPAPRE